MAGAAVAATALVAAMALIVPMRDAELMAEWHAAELPAVQVTAERHAA
jgi:hypothetical protein